jgi:2-polyprenyl-3-methyl-5-hydroxy-6-metoxy-1,4-benzoquinol methylase
VPVLRSCPVCSADTCIPLTVLYSPTHPLRVVVCEGCGLVYVNPMFTNAEKDRRSPDLRLLHRSRSTEHSNDAAFRHSLRRMNRSFAGLERYLRPGQRVLEIGSGDGAMLALLQRAGVQPTGVEMDGIAAEATIRNMGVPICVGVFEELSFPGGSFDAVVLVHIIEHFFDPVSIMRKVHEVLKPGGIVFLETPNILRPKVGPRRVFSFAHNFHFSPRTLALALHRAGFRATALRENRRDSFQILAQKVCAGDLGCAPRTHSYQSVVRTIRQYQRRYFTNLQFLWRKLPWLRDGLVYGVHRDLAGPALERWLAAA